MKESIEFTKENVKEVNDKIAGQVLEEIKVTDTGYDEYLDLKLADGRTVSFRYDYIYDFTITEKIPRGWRKL